MTTLAQISESQAQKATTANENFTAVSPAGLFGRKASTTTGLTWGYFGGYIDVDGVSTSIADGTVALTASQTNYIEATRAGVVSANTTSFTAGRIKLYTAVTSGSAITSYTDYREFYSKKSVPQVSVAVTSGDVTLTVDQARVDILQTTGVLTGNRSVIVPAVAWAWIVDNQNSGAFTTTVKTAAGSGVAVPQGARAVLYCDGTDVKAAVTSITGLTSSRVVITDSSGAVTTDADLTFNGTTLTANTLTVSTGDLTVTPGSITTGSATALSFKTSGGTQLQIPNSPTAVNFCQIYGSATGNIPTVQAAGSDSNVGTYVLAKGTWAIAFGNTSQLTAFSTVGAASGVNYGHVVGAATGGAVSYQVEGSDANIGNTVKSKGTGTLFLDPQSGDIKWGKALVALGGGAAPTLGTIGGSGPATAAQNTWMRVLDSTGAAFWVPAWK